MRKLVRACNSVVKLLVLLVRGTFLWLAALIRGDRQKAGFHARQVSEVLHEDLVKIILAVQRLLPLWRRPAATIDRILIIKLDRIGDMVNTTPVFDVLHEAYPRARLDIVGHPGPLSLLEGDERIGERIPYKTWMYHPVPIRPGGPRCWLLLLKLLWRRYPLVIYLRGTFPFLWLGLTSRLAAAKFVAGEPVVSRYLKALEPLLGPVRRPRPRLHPTPEAAAFAQALLDKGDEPDGPRVVLHASASSDAKAWPKDRFARLADELCRSSKARVHFLGGPEDRARLQEISGMCQERHSYHSDLRLPEVVAVIAAADLFVGNDSGLSHIASAVGTRSVVLWGPVNLTMARPEAPREECKVLYHELACRAGCPEVYCVNPKPFDCLNRIQTDEVLEAVQELLPIHESSHRVSLPLFATTGSTR
jgi:ADP-heptose:LPS heptosyltransferase